MAGDWIKMRTDLVDDPAVVRIAAALGIDEDSVVGKLHRLWSWADRHTTNGVAVGINGKWVDRYVQCPGFAEAMQDAKWIVLSDQQIEFPGFEKHNGASAKRRLENAIRQRLSRAKRDKGVTGVTRDLIPRPFVRAVMERDAYTCVYCGMESDAEREAGKKRKMSVDHITPVTRGGRSAMDNLVCCCKLCNSEKNDRTPEEWGMELEFLQDGVTYVNGLIHESVTDVTKPCDNDVTKSRPREEKRRDITPPTPLGAVGASMTLGVEDLKDHKRLAAWHDAGCPGLDPPVPSHLLAAVIATANECRTVGRRPMKLFWHKMRQLAATGQYDGPGDLYDDAKRLVAKRPKGSP